LKKSIDINCDLGEGFDNEAQLMPYISSCNIACGGHAGNEDTIANTIQLAVKHGVKLGAHPSFPDKENFGRRVMDMSSLELQKSIERQIGLMVTQTKRLGLRLHHVKPHGALYNLAANDEKTAQIIVNAVRREVGDVFLYVPYNSVIARLAKQEGVKIKVEAFADRNYNSDLSLVSRNYKNAVLYNKQVVVDHLLRMICEKKVISIDEVEVGIDAQTYCIHGDNTNAEELVKYISEKLLENKIVIE